MKKAIVILIALSAFTPLKSQKLLNEIGAWGGGSYYIGDLNPYTQYKCTHLAGGLVYRRNINKRVALRLNFSYGMVSAADSLSKIDANINRNLSFRSRIFEIGPILELNFVDYVAGRRMNKRQYYKEIASPYLFIGLNYFKMNPQAAFGNDDFIDLQTLGTEGQGSDLNSKKKYGLNQLSIPLGIGAKFSVTEFINISFEYGIRKTFTDYLDDVSGKYVDPVALQQQNGILSAYYADQSFNQEGMNANNEGAMRGNPKSKDWYSFSGFVITFCLGRPSECKGIFK